MRNVLPFLATASLTIAVLACGGGSGPTTAPSTTPPPGGPTAPPTNGPGATTTPTAAPTPGNPTGLGVCDLVTDQELAAILGVAVTTDVIQGPPDTCSIQADGAPMGAMVLNVSDPATGFDAAAVFNAYASSGTATAISGIGDAAIFESSTELLIFLKGNSVVSLALFPEDATEDERMDLMEQIATIAAGRL